MIDIKFDDNGLIPCIVQDCDSNEVLMLAYMNKEAYDKTLETGMMHYWSRSRKKLWLKGETSGHFQYVKSISPDCDEDTLLIKVEQKGVACHTGNRSCFFRESDRMQSCTDAAILQELYDLIADRVVNPREGSYTNYLFEKGLDKMLKKVGEETAEVIIAAKNRSRDEIKYEVADLLYHLLVLMVEEGVKPGDIFDELKNRRNQE